MNGNTAYILGVALNSTPKEQLLGELINLASTQAQTKPVVIFTPNPEFMVEASRNSEFKTNLNKADINLIDGFGLFLAARIFKQKVSRVSGADMVEALLQVGEEKQWTIGVVGARRGEVFEVEQLFNRLKEKYSQISFVNLDEQENLKIKNLKFEIVFACHGMKKQEEWILQNKDKIKAKVYMGIGGSLDFLTGFSRRAPITIRKLGLEWLWRGLHRPSHFKRIWKATVIFSWLIIKERLIVLFRLNSK